MRRPGDLAARLGVAVIGVPIVLGSLVLSGWTLGIVMALTAGLGTREFYRIARHRGQTPFDALGILGSAASCLLATALPTVNGFAPPALGLLLGLYAASFALAIFRRWPDGSPMGSAATTISGVLYVGVPLAFVPILRALPETRGAGMPDEILSAMGFVLLPLLVTWAGDTAAYFVGHGVGRTKLAPAISPGKTLEGGVGGLVGAVAASMGITVWLLSDFTLIQISLVQAAWIGLVIGVVGQLGDLVESALKREAGVKDSGGIFPGHGGMLDRLDSLLWTFPVTWFLLEISGVLP